jgi:hypothetical protein
VWRDDRAEMMCGFMVLVEGGWGFNNGYDIVNC